MTNLGQKLRVYSQVIYCILNDELFPQTFQVSLEKIPQNKTQKNTLLITTVLPYSAAYQRIFMIHCHFWHITASSA